MTNSRRPSRAPRLRFSHLLTATLAVALAAGCAKSRELPGDRGPVAASIATNVYMPTYRTLAERAAAVEAALDAWASDTTIVNRDAARAAFSSFMDTLMEAEMMLAGPLGPSSASPGGMDHFDEMYSWAVLDLSLCGVDRLLAGASHTDATALAEQPLNVRTMAAVEYLLFVEGTQDGCAREGSTVVITGWDALAADPAALTTRRAEMAATLAGLVRGRADALVTAWETNFLEATTAPSSSHPNFRSAQDVLNAMADSLFVLDQITKDMRIGPPAGLVECATETCPEALESKFAMQSKERILGNLRGFRLVYTGGDGLGFEDLLRDPAIGQDAFATTMLQHIDAAIAAVEAIDGTLADALVNDLADVRAAHAAISLVDTDLKTTFLGTLALDPPHRAGADND